MKTKNERLTLRTPFKILPPATPPFKSSTSAPGLLTSNERITEKKKYIYSILIFDLFFSNIPLTD